MTTNINFLSLISNKIDSNKIDQDFLIWYILYCHSAIENDNTIKTEKHHILPKKLFPEFSNLNKNSWNLATLNLTDHFYVHYLLSKAINSKSTRFAFNMMRRIFTKNDNSTLSELSTLYMEFRTQLSKDFSNINKGRKCTPEQLKRLSENQKNCVLVRHKNSPITSPHFKVSIFDPEYINGDLIHNATGTTKTDLSRQLMSKNGIKNKKKYHNTITQEGIYLDENQNIPENFILGENKEFKINARLKFIDSKFYYNPLTQEQKRYKNINDVPVGWLPGKIFFGADGNNFNKYIFYVNHVTGEKGKILENEVLPKYCTRPNMKDAYIINDLVTFDIKIASDITGFSLNTLRTIKDSPNNIITTKTRDTNIRKFIGQKYGNIGVIHITINQLFADNNYIRFKFI